MQQDLFPYLTKDHTYIYVDVDFTPKITTPFAAAEQFTNTGYAVVRNTKGESAVLNKKGQLVVPFADRYLSLEVLHDQLTVVFTRETYTKNTRFWEWEWNIFSGLKTEVRRQDYKVYILETNQVLYSQHLQADESVPYTINSVDNQYFIFNETLYKRKGKRIKKLETSILRALSNNRFLQQKGKSFALFSLKDKDPFPVLEATNQLHFSVNEEEITLKDVNKSRYYSSIPEILYDAKTETYWLEPYFDKKFPSTLRVRNETDIAYLKQVTYVNAIPDYSYFILGVFNYDTWSYDWKYVSEDGQLYDYIEATDFFVVDVIGRVMRPHPQEIIPSNYLPSGWTVYAVTKFYAFTHLFKVAIQQEGQDRRYGLWNRQSQEWELSPLYRDLYWLNADLGLLALAEEDNQYQLYCTKTKQFLSSRVYKSISSTGWVTWVDPNNTPLAFYLDFTTGKEYRE
ncbi:hypothetical protein [Myroides sp. DW712]|uniref:hypothetical protein n=1 Tax=Myroides sp. DW712 TaxID=3389800 RepID=UPI00397849E0